MWITHYIQGKKLPVGQLYIYTIYTFDGSWSEFCWGCTVSHVAGRNHRLAIDLAKRQVGFFGHGGVIESMIADPHHEPWVDFSGHQRNTPLFDCGRARRMPKWFLEAYEEWLVLPGRSPFLP